MSEALRGSNDPGRLPAGRAPSPLLQINARAIVVRHAHRPWWAALHTRSSAHESHERRLLACPSLLEEAAQRLVWVARALPARGHASSRIAFVVAVAVIIVAVVVVLLILAAAFPVARLAVVAVWIFRVCVHRPVSIPGPLDYGLSLPGCC